MESVMADKITFFHNPQSRGLIAHWMLEEVGAPYEIQLIRFDKGENRKPEFLAVNPMGKIPTIIHRGVVVTEAGAVCTYLADAFPANELAPAMDDPARGTYLRWLFFGAGCIEPALVDHLFSRPPVERKGALGYGSYEETLNALEKAIRPGPFLLGERFSAADVYIGSEIVWGLMAKSLEPRASFLTYKDRVTARPAYQRVVEQNMKLGEQLKKAG
jgi:glutathione S-transferase